MKKLGFLRSMFWKSQFFVEICQSLGLMVRKFGFCVKQFGFLRLKCWKSHFFVEICSSLVFRGGNLAEF